VILAVDDEPIGHPFEFTKIVLRKNAGDTVRINYSRDGRRSRTTLKIEKLPEQSGLELARVKLGLELQEIPSDVARLLDVNSDIGLIVTGVLRNGPAYGAGFEKGDLILRIGGRPVADLDRLASLLEHLRAGRRVQVLLYRRNGLYRGMIKVR
jgi:S1-C subfamily serine protease